MATLTFARVSGYTHRTASDAVNLRTAAVGTTSFVATTNDVDTNGWDFVVFGISYTEGDETSYNVKAQGYDGATWRDLAFKATQGSAVSAVSPDEIVLTAATFATAYGAGTIGNLALPPVSCLGFQKVRMVVKSIGGTPTGTIGITATAGVYVGAGA